IDPVAGKVVEERLDDRPLELPRLDERLTGRRHRYGYAAEFDSLGDGPAFRGVIKHDLVAGGSEVRTFGPGTAAGEPVFVPAAAGSGEDEGWLLTVVYDGERDGSDLYVLDATDIDASAVAKVRLP